MEKDIRKTLKVTDNAAHLAKVLSAHFKQPMYQIIEDALKYQYEFLKAGNFIDVKMPVVGEWAKKQKANGKPAKKAKVSNGRKG